MALTGDRGHPFTRLATLGDPASAQLCAALLQSAGIEVRVHSEALGPYPVTLGQLAEAELWVPEPDLEEAAAVLLESEIDYVLAEDPGTVRPPPATRTIVGLLLLVIVFAVARVVIQAI